MKQPIFTSGMIPSADDLDFQARTKNYGIEQTRYDLLEQQAARVKGVVKNSGLTSGHSDDPLKVYIIDTTVNIYSGVAYDGFEGRSNRIWVPDDPSDVPVDAAAAVSNYDNVDMPDETLAKDFSTEMRPPREDIKTFTAADLSGTWYVSIRYIYGGYDPITIPSDGSQADSKRYDSYIIDVSRTSAASLFATDGYPWMQLATLNWDGGTIWLESDDRVFASCTITVDEEQIQLHQTRFHSNAIVSIDRAKCRLVINNVTQQMELSNSTFASGEGLLINGKFVQTVNNTFIQFDPTIIAGMYYFFINQAGTLEATVNFATANENLFLGQCYWNGVDRLQLNSSITTQEVRDRRRFGGLGKYNLDWEIVGPTYDYDDNLSLEQAHDEFTRPRAYSHGNCIVFNPGSTTLLPVGVNSYQIGSLGCVFGSDFVTVNDVDPDDRVCLNGPVSGHGSQSFELYTLFPTGENTVYITGGAGRRLVYIDREALAPDGMHSYSVNVRSFNGSLDQDSEYPLCTFYWNGAAVQIDASHPVVDRRVWGSIGYAHIQRNKNRAGYNNLPQLMVSMWGQVEITANNISDEIFLTHDWGINTNNGGGSSPASGGERVFAIKPLIAVYHYGEPTGPNGTPLISPWPCPTKWNSIYAGLFNDVAGFSVIGHGSFCIDETSFYIMNHNVNTDTFYWIAMGPPFINSANYIKGKNNPNYGEEV